MNTLAVIAVDVPPTSPDQHLDQYATSSRDLLLVNASGSKLWRDIADRHGWRYYGAPPHWGPPAAWNLGMAVARGAGYDYCSPVSPTVIWAGGPDVWYDVVEEHADDRGILSPLAFDASAWHVRLVDLVGRFDENLDGDCTFDWVRRLHVAGLLAAPLPVVDIAATSTPTLRAARRAYTKKWGGPPGKERWKTPFGHQPISYWRPVV